MCCKLCNLYKFASLSVCLFVSNKRQNSWTNQAQILFGTSHDPWEGLWMINISKISLQQNLIVIKFWKSTKLFDKIYDVCWCLFYNVSKSEYVHSWKKKIGAKRPVSLIIIYCKWKKKIFFPDVFIRNRPYTGNLVFK